MKNQNLNSPCIGVCEINPRSGCCKGCYRTLQEIAVWISLDEDAREKILRKIPERKNIAGME